MAKRNSKKFEKRSFVRSIYALGTIYTVLTAIVVTDGCKKMIWERVHLNKTLVNHDIKSVTAESETQCRIKCWFTDGCLSYSYGPISGGPKICNLSNSDHKMHPRDLVDKPDFRYRSAE
ncbi:predicted protein, partial [Nematostella vectensis]